MTALSAELPLQAPRAAIASGRNRNYLENLGAPGRATRLKYGVRLRDGAEDQLLNAQSARKLRPRKAAEVYRA